MPRFAIDLGAEDSLVLRESWTVAPLQRLIEANLDRLREWEPWAQGEQTEGGMASFTAFELHQWVDGKSLPAAIVSAGEIVGSVGARIDPYAGVADVGYWIDSSAEGRGLVTRAARALIEHLHTDLGVRRIEIRAAVDNGRSRAVAERLGFTLEGVLKSAQVVGEKVNDVALYAYIP